MTRMFIATFALVCLLCIVVLLWLHAMERGAERYLPTRRQRRAWRRERLVLPPMQSINRRRAS